MIHKAAVCVCLSKRHTDAHPTARVGTCVCVMVFSLSDSTAAFCGGLFLAIWGFVFVRSRVGNTTFEDGTGAFLHPDDAQFLLTINSVLLLCVVTQFVDLNAHRHDLGWQGLTMKPQLNGVLGFTIVATIPPALCLSTAMSLSGGMAILLYVCAAISVLHTIGCIAFDAPLSGWATVEVVPAQFMGKTIYAVVHGGFGLRDDKTGFRFFGGGARAAVFLVVLFLGTCAHLFLSLDYLWRPRSDCKSDLHWCETVAWATGLGLITAWVALAVAALVGVLGNIQNHTASLWTRFSLLGLLVHGLVSMRHQSVGLYALYLALGFGVWLIAYSLTRCVEPRTRRDDDKVAR